MGERLYRITVEAITLFTLAERSARGSFGAGLEEAVDDGERVRWKKVGGPMVNDESPEAALSDLTEALKHYGGVDGYRQAVAEAKRHPSPTANTRHDAPASAALEQSQGRPDA